MDILAAILVTASWLALAEALKYRVGATVDEIMNTCMDGRNQKTKPGPESSLFNHCSPWTKRSCCTSETAQGIALDRRWLNFDWHHCGSLSPQCTQQFVKDLCFYECSPNVGPYLQLDVRKVRNQRYVNVPMCQRTCDTWWEACKADLTCTDNWTQNFNWSTGINTCPTGSTCRTFQDVFANASSFCEGIWDHGFKVVPDSEDCFRLWFSADENPNEAVARRAAEKMLGLTGASVRVVSAPFQLTLSVVMFLLLC